MLPLRFWHIPRMVMKDPGWNIEEPHRFHALIAYQLLFGGRLALADSDYLNCRALRGAVLATIDGQADETSQFLRTLLDERYIVIAKRKDSTLGHTALSMNTVGRANLVPAEWFREDSADLVHLQSTSTEEDSLLEWSLDDGARYYSEQLLKLLARPHLPMLPDHVRLRIAAIVQERKDNGDHVGWAMFASDGEVWRKLAAEDLQYRDFVYRTLSQAPHAGFLPDLLQLNPVYMDDVAEAIDLWRGRNLWAPQRREAATISLSNGFSFADYEEALAVLDFPAIEALVLSDQRRVFSDTCREFASGSQSLDEVRRTFIEYKTLIDHVVADRITSPTPQGFHAEVKAAFQVLREDGTKAAVDLAIESITGVPHLSLLYSLVHRARTGTWPSQVRANRAKSEANAKVIAEMHRLQRDGRRFDGKLISDGKDGADFAVAEREVSDVYSGRARN